GARIWWEGSVLAAALERKIVQKSGSFFSFEDERLGQGRQNATAFLREHPDLAQRILARLQAETGPERVVSPRLEPPPAPSTNGDAPAVEEQADEKEEEVVAAK